MSEKNSEDVAAQDESVPQGNDTELATTGKAQSSLSNTSRQRSVAALDAKIKVTNQRTLGEVLVVLVGMFLMAALAKEKLIEGYMAAAVIAILAGVKLSDVMQASKKQ